MIWILFAVLEFMCCIYVISIHIVKVHLKSFYDVEVRLIVAHLKLMNDLYRLSLNVSSTVMKSSNLLVLFALISTVLAAYDLDHGYTNDAAYRRRQDSEKVNKKMVEYWSRPEVLATLPEPMREKVHIYIKKFPQYHYKGSSGTSGKSRRKTHPCVTQ